MLFPMIRPSIIRTEQAEAKRDESQKGIQSIPPDRSHSDTPFSFG